jgi:hypothetical protein
MGHKTLWILGLLGIAAWPLTVQGREPQDAAIRIIEGAPEAVFLVAGDLNGDGQPDLALAEATFPTGRSQEKPVFRLSLLHQKAGRFSMPPDKTVDLPAAPSGLALGDFDRDGKNDLAVGLRSLRSLALYLGGEGFGKAHRSEYNNDSGASGLSAGHMAGAGVTDFMTGAAWRQWGPQGQFACGYFCGPERNDNWRSALADLDRNGTDDVVFTTYAARQRPSGSNNCLRLCYGPFLHLGLVGPNAASEVVTLTSPLANSDRPALGPIMVRDLNGDWQPDVIVGGPNQTLVYFQNSPTGFSDQAGPSLVLEGVTPCLAEDVDGNGLSDLILRHLDGKTLSIWYQQKGAPLTATWRAQSRTVTWPRPAVAITAGDVDGDGKKELLAGLAGGGLAIASPP